MRSLGNGSAFYRDKNNLWVTPVRVKSIIFWSKVMENIYINRENPHAALNLVYRHRRTLGSTAV